MHFSFPFSIGQVLWALTFAAQLVLLVVLLGRDLVKRYPWFTASIVVFALRLLVEVLLTGRMAPVPLRAVFITLADLMALVGLLVVVEIARRAFSGLRRRTWVLWTLAALAVAGGVTAAWGPWPEWKQLAWNTPIAILGLMQLAAQKTDMLMDFLTVELGLLVVLFGRHFKAGWRSHTQQIAVGLSTVAISWLGVQGIWQIVAKSVHPHSQEEYERIIGLGGKLVNANKVIYIVVLLWWIATLWFDEPGAAALQVASQAAELLPPPEPPQTGDPL
jgi:hypothetical protein